MATGVSGTRTHEEPLSAAPGVGGGRLEGGAGAWALSRCGDAEMGDPAAPADVPLSVEWSHSSLSAQHHLECGFSSGELI